MLYSVISAKSIYLSSEIDTSITNIGNIITWKLIANNSNQGNVIFPELNLEGDSISLRSQKSILTDLGEIGNIMEIVFWDTGRFYTPNYQIRILSNEGNNEYGLEAERLAIDVISIIEPSMNMDLRPVKGPIKVKSLIPYLEILLTILLVIILIGIFWVWTKRLRAMNQEPIDSLIKSPSVIAMDRLSKLSYKGFYKEFYTELSHISREFIESTRYIRALEMTTEDIIKNKDLFLIEEKKFDNWVALLFKADMVKYARQDVDHSEMISDKDEIIKFIKNF